MKQRIKLAQALVHDPDLLFLDEPTNGMDPKGREEMLELIRDLAHNKGVNLILSSHLLPDVEYTCDHVIVLDKGAVATSGSIEASKGPAGRVFEVRVKGELAPFLAALAAAGLECHETDEDVMRVFVPGALGAPGDDQRRICAWRSRAGVQVRHCVPACRRSRTSLPARWVSHEPDSRSELPPLRGRAARRPAARWARHRVDRHRGRSSRARCSWSSCSSAWIPFIVRTVQHLRRHDVSDGGHACRWTRRCSCSSSSSRASSCSS